MRTFKSRTFVFKLILISAGLVIAFVIGYIAADNKPSTADTPTTEISLQEIPLPKPDPSLSPEYSPLYETLTDVVVFEQIFFDTVGEEIDFSEFGHVIKLGEHSVLAVGYQQNGRDRVLTIFHQFPWFTVE